MHVICRFQVVPLEAGPFEVPSKIGILMFDLPRLCYKAFWWCQIHVMGHALWMRWDAWLDAIEKQHD